MGMRENSEVNFYLDLRVAAAGQSTFRQFISFYIYRPCIN